MKPSANIATGFSCIGLRYGDVAALTPAERVAMIRSGLPIKAVDELAKAMGLTRSTLCNWLDISARTRQRSRLFLPLRESERLLGLIRLISEVQHIVLESGIDPEFDAARWTSAWLNIHHPALGGEKPSNFLDLADGRELLTNLLRQLQNGAFA